GSRNRLIITGSHSTGNHSSAGDSCNPKETPTACFHASPRFISYLLDQCQVVPARLPPEKNTVGPAACFKALVHFRIALYLNLTELNGLSQQTGGSRGDGQQSVGFWSLDLALDPVLAHQPRSKLL